MTLPRTSNRVPRNTREKLNNQIEQETLERLTHYADHPEEIDERLEELDREWDTERTLEANASTLVVLGTGAGVLINRRFLALPALVGAFLLQHAVQGWCPPLPVLRQLGVRTQREIDEERFALKALRGDFGAISSREPGSYGAVKTREAVKA